MTTQGRTQLGAHRTSHRVVAKRVSYFRLLTLHNVTAFNHRQDPAAEAEYDRLRDLARQEHAKMQSCFDRVCLDPLHRGLALRFPSIPAIGHVKSQDTPETNQHRLPHP